MELINFHTADSTAHCALLRDEAAINSVLCRSRQHPSVPDSSGNRSEVVEVLASVAVVGGIYFTSQK